VQEEISRGANLCGPKKRNELRRIRKMKRRDQRTSLGADLYCTSEIQLEVALVTTPAIGNDHVAVIHGVEDQAFVVTGSASNNLATNAQHCQAGEFLAPLKQKDCTMAPDPIHEAAETAS
jgi:hypothetical protein